MTWCRTAEREGKAEGQNRGILFALTGLVRDGVLSIKDAAFRANMQKGCIWSRNEKNINKRMYCSNIFNRYRNTSFSFTLNLRSHIHSPSVSASPRGLPGWCCPRRRWWRRSVSSRAERWRTGRRGRSRCRLRRSRLGKAAFGQPRIMPTVYSSGFRFRSSRLPGRGRFYKTGSIKIEMICSRYFWKSPAALPHLSGAPASPVLFIARSSIKRSAYRPLCWNSHSHFLRIFVLWFIVSHILYIINRK